MSDFGVGIAAGTTGGQETDQNAALGLCDGATNPALPVTAPEVDHMVKSTIAETLQATDSVTGGTLDGGICTVSNSETGNTAELDPDEGLTFNSITATPAQIAAIAAAMGLSSVNPVVASDESLLDKGRLTVPPAYYQTGSEGSQALTSASHGISLMFVPDAQYDLSAFARRISAVTGAGTGTIAIRNNAKKTEPNGALNGSTTNVAPTMTANNAPSPYVVRLVDSSGNNAEAGAGYEAYKAMDGSIATDNGTRSGAAPTALAPVYYGVTLSAATCINKYRFVSWANASADIRAYPKAWTLWGSNVASPTWHTDTDWTQIGTQSAVSDPGSGVYAEYALTNGTAYLHYRWKFTDRNGSNAYMALGEIVLIAAQTTDAPGTVLATLGTKASGSGAGWTILTIGTSYNLTPGTKYHITEFGEASKNYSCSICRSNTVTGSAHPDGCKSQYTTDGGTTWSRCLQDSLPALWNCILNPADPAGDGTNPVPQLYYGRRDGDTVFIPGTGQVTIPTAGISLDLHAHSSPDADFGYHLWLNYSGSALVLTATTDAVAMTSGVKHKTAATGYRYLGDVYPVECQTGQYGPVDVMDRALLTWPGRTRVIGKQVPYGPSNIVPVLPTYKSRWNQGSDWTIEVLCIDTDLDITAIACGYYGATSPIHLGLLMNYTVLDGGIPMLRSTGYSMLMMRRSLPKLNGKKTLTPLAWTGQDSASQLVLCYNSDNFGSPRASFEGMAYSKAV
jgi:hypothetical protein